MRGISDSSSARTAAIIRKQRPPEPYKGKGIPLRGRVRAAQGREARMSVRTKEERRLKRRRRVRAKIAGTANRPRISRCSPLESRTVRADDRRRRSAHARGRQLVRARTAHAVRRRKRSGELLGEQQSRGSARPSSTAAATSPRPRACVAERSATGITVTFPDGPTATLSSPRDDPRNDRSINPAGLDLQSASSRTTASPRSLRRPTLLLHRARRRRRRTRHRRRRLRQGEQVPARDPEGHQRAKKDLFPYQARQEHHHPRRPGCLRLGQRPA